MKKRRSKINNKKIKELFREVHGIKYDYSKVNYRTMHHKVTIVCLEHGDFEQIPNAHFRRCQGCPKCATITQSKRKKGNTKSFIEKSKLLNKDRYDYSKTIYGKNAHEKVTITCRIHGTFTMSPNSHLSKNCQLIIVTHCLPLIESVDQVYDLENKVWKNSDVFIEEQKNI